MSTVFLRALFGSRIGTGFVTTAQLNAEANTRALADTNLDNTKADLAGDTFTGNIIVPTGTLSTHAVNKGQVDTDLGLKANKSGDTFTGNIVIPDGTLATHAVSKGQLDTKANKSGDTFTGNIIVPTGTLSTHAVNKGQVDTDLGLKANKSGDTFTGNIVIPDGTIAGHGVNKGQLDTKANATHTHVRADITDLTEFVEVNSIPIGMPFPQWFESDASAVVTKYPTRFVKLSKNLEGAYNSGKLGVSSAITTDETTFYTATISDAGSPLNGESVTLINSTENTTGGVSAQPAFLGAGETAQTKLVNRLQGHWHSIFQFDGAISDHIAGSNADYGFLADGSVERQVGSPRTDNVNGTPRLGKTNQPDAVTAVWYMRIK